MDYSKFYTPPQIASLLIKMLDIEAPSEVIDICCGSCNLLHAAGARWKKANLVGVDIAKNISANAYFTQMDGRKFAIEHTQLYPLVLANPPFDYVEKIREFPQLYQGIFETYRTSRLENEMLLANLLLLESSGTLLIIMPSSFVEAERNRDIRKVIGKNYYIKKIIKLPEDTFGTTKINSYALEIRCNLNGRHYTKLYSAVKNDYEYCLSVKGTISQKNIREGNWYIGEQHISDLSWDIRRGNISSQAFRDFGLPILHTAKHSSNWMPSIRYVESYNDSPVYAGAGDIIVSRIGKSAGQWCQYWGERIPISDCLYCIRDPDGRIAENIMGKKYNLAQKGVATRYVTINDFKIWYKSVIDRIKE